MDVVDLVGRILFALVFLDNGWAHCVNRAQMVPFGRSIGAPMAEFSVPFTGVMMLVGGVLIILGVWADLGALLLVLFLPAAGYLGHAYWREQDPMMRAAQKAQFWKNIALAGAALFFLYAFYEFGDGIALTVGNSPSLFA
jgi:putative oxidoreductase